MRETIGGKMSDIVTMGDLKREIENRSNDLELIEDKPVMVYYKLKENGESITILTVIKKTFKNNVSESLDKNE